MKMEMETSVKVKVEALLTRQVEKARRDILDEVETLIVPTVAQYCLKQMKT